MTRLSVSFMLQNFSQCRYHRNMINLIINLFSNTLVYLKEVQ